MPPPCEVLAMPPPCEVLAMPPPPLPNPLKQRHHALPPPIPRPGHVAA